MLFDCAIWREVALKVLVVEDSSFARMAVIKVVSALLSQAEFFEASDGEQGLNLFKSVQPELVLTDLLMPKMTGEELIKEIRLLDQQVPIVVMSANVQKPARAKVESFGITGFITKPIIGDSAKSLQTLLAGCFHA